MVLAVAVVAVAVEAINSLVQPFILQQVLEVMDWW
jgi:hypothetical protein